MDMKLPKPLLAAVALVFSLTPFMANADSGFYVGGGIGGATLEADVGDIDFGGLTSFDEDDTGFKVFAGYNFDLPVVNLGIEAGYVDFGAPEIDTALGQIELDPTAQRKVEHHLASVHQRRQHRVRDVAVHPPEEVVDPDPRGHRVPLAAVADLDIG